MSSKIFKAISLVTLAVLIVSLVFIMGSTYGYLSMLQEEQIKNQVELVSNGVELAGEEYFDSIEIDGVRVTWISPDGTVLYDNESMATDMENHLERPEVQEAIEKGYGESSRYSSTLLEKQLYCARLLKDGSIVRISDRHSTVLTILLSFAQPICLAVLVIGIMAFVIASNLSKKIVEPINNINLDDPLTTDTYDELQPLLNRLAMQQIQLRRDKAELEKTEEIRREFTSNVSHELKTPLHVISGYAELIKDGLVAEDDIKPFSEKIYGESVRMSQLVEDVIDLSRLDIGVSDSDIEEIDVYRIAANAVDSIYSFSQEKGVNISLEGERAVIYGVPQLIHSIVYNLCDNAVKYNHRGGSVNVSVLNDSKTVKLIVSDTGIGIGEEHQSRIFERFYRVDKSHSKEVGGTGLGLSIVKHAAAIHDASIEVESTPGEGTTITVNFPKR